MVGFSGKTATRRAMPSHFPKKNPYSRNLRNSKHPISSSRPTYTTKKYCNLRLNFSSQPSGKLHASVTRAATEINGNLRLKQDES